MKPPFTVEVNTGNGWQGKLNTFKLPQAKAYIQRLEKDRARERRKKRIGNSPLPRLSVRIVDADGNTIEDARQL